MKLDLEGGGGGRVCGSAGRLAALREAEGRDLAAAHAAECRGPAGHRGGRLVTQPMHDAIGGDDRAVAETRVKGDEDLVGAIYTEGDLRGSDFSGSDLRAAIFSRAVMPGVNLEGADMSNSFLDYVVLRGSKAISRRHAVIATINPNATGVGTGGRGGAWADPQLVLSCVGKNHVHVNGEMHAPGSSGVRLRDGDTLSIGGVLVEVAITGVVVVTEEGIPP